MTSEKIPLSDFQKSDLRVGKILKVEDHPNADKLYVITVDLAEKIPRKIVTGLKDYYKKEELENKKAIFITNLEPRKVRGIESDGMILAAINDDENKIVILAPEKDIDIGSKIS
ncbi:MAG: hypothetical protein IIA87_03020 [Nanoarchaeota archaeon]|nr:hypothetical protein [Nanoarchaeota archaeon]